MFCVIWWVTGEERDLVGVVRATLVLGGRRHFRPLDIVMTLSVIPVRVLKGLGYAECGICGDLLPLAINIVQQIKV